MKNKPFSFHIEVSGRRKCELPLRISCSNMFKEHSRRGGNIIQLSLADISTKWTVVALDIPSILSMPLEEKFRQGKDQPALHGDIKSLKFCANLSVRGAYSSVRLKDRLLCAFRLQNVGVICALFRIISTPLKEATRCLLASIFL